MTEETTQAWYEKALRYGNIIVRLEQELKDYRDLVDTITEQIVTNVEDDYYRQNIINQIDSKMKYIQDTYHAE
jgi:hypothetical protein